MLSGSVIIGLLFFLINYFCRKSKKYKAAELKHIFCRTMSYNIIICSFFLIDNKPNLCENNNVCICKNIAHYPEKGKIPKGGGTKLRVYHGLTTVMSPELPMFKGGKL